MEIATMILITDRSSHRLMQRRFTWILLLAFAWVLQACSTDPKPSTMPGNIPPVAVESSDLLQRAKDRTSRGDTVGAIESYTQLLQKEPAQVAALGNRALLFAARGRNEEALQDYNSLLLHDAQNYAAIDRRAALLYRMGQYHAALEDLELIKSHRPEDAELLNRIAEAHLHLAEFPSALFAVEQALKLRRGWTVALRNRAAIYYAMGDFTHAEQDYILLLKSDPRDSEALNGVGLLAQFRDHDLTKAETHFRKAVLSNPYNAGAWYNIGYLEAQQGKPDLAKKDFGEAIRCDSKYAEAYVNRGLLLMREENTSLALADFEAALDLQPTNTHTQLLRGWARCASGNRTPGCLDLADAKAAHEPGVQDLIDRYCK